MNVYDFDKTIFYPDSSYTFIMYCLRRYTRAVVYALPTMAKGALDYAAGKSGKAELKTGLFSFLAWLDNTDEIVQEFWDRYRANIGQWYLDRRKPDDVIVSASPEFLLKPIAQELGVRLICTPMDKATGLVFGENCSETEKVRRFFTAYPNAHIDEFYSDSLTDAPLASHAERAYIVDRSSVLPWPWDYWNRK